MRVVGVVMVLFLGAGCFTPVCDGFDCDGGAGGGGTPSGGAGGNSSGTGGGRTGGGGGGSTGGGSASGAGGGSPGSGGGASTGPIDLGGVTSLPDAGMACTNAVTVFATAAECNPSTCSDGCCDGARCIRTCAQSASRCGVFAEACQSCAAPGQCDHGRCRGAPTCSGCFNTDICNPGTLPASCGSGSSCQICEACVNQQCVTPAKHVGDACSADADCASMGRGAVCRKQTSPGGLAYPGGFCTIPCEGAWEVCPASSACASFPSRFGESARLCVPNCNAGGAGCRAGYACYPGLAWNGTSQCWISPSPPLVGVAPIGSPCVADTDCGAGRRCLRPMLPPDYRLNGYFGGYCTSDCALGTACGNGLDVCISELFSTPVGNASVIACKAACTAPGFQAECRTEYRCQASPSGNWCAPSCLFRPCPAGTQCNVATTLCE